MNGSRFGSNWSEKKINTYAAINTKDGIQVSGNFSINLGYFVDNITAIMLVVVSLIGFLVHLYSTEYMKDDSKYSRYFAFLGIFIFSMNKFLYYRKN